MIATLLDQEPRQTGSVQMEDQKVIDRDSDAGVGFSDRWARHQQRVRRASPAGSGDGNSPPSESLRPIDASSGTGSRNAGVPLPGGKSGRRIDRSVPPQPQSMPSDAFPSRQELQVMANRAEQRANHELGRLVETLDLDDDQQEFVFEILARSSSDFLPAMSIESELGDVVEPLLESTDSIEEAIEVVLDEEQASQYIEENEERRAWWWATLRDFIPDEELPDVVEETESYYP